MSALALPDTTQPKQNNSQNKQNEKPTPLTVIFENIPQKIKEAGARLCVWKYTYKPKPGKWDKPPYQVNGRLAESNNPATWATFDQVKRAYESGLWDGIGIFMGGGLDDGLDNLAGCDWDHISDPGIWHSLTSAEVTKECLSLSSYCETSPSGDGLRAFILLDRNTPLPDKKAGGREVYNSGHYLTITGHRLPGSPDTINEVNKAGFDRFYSNLKAAKEKKPKGIPKRAKVAQSELSELNKFTPESGLSDTQILQMAGEKHGEKYIFARYSNLEETDKKKSETDFQFCCILSPWCDSPTHLARMLRVYRVRPKTQDREDYLLRTAGKAFNERRYYYDPVLKELKPISSLITANDRLKISDTSGGRSQIQVNDNSLDDLTDATFRAILKRYENSPEFFVRHGKLVRVNQDEKGHSFIEEITEDSMRWISCRAADFIKVTPGGEICKVHPPTLMVKSLLALGGWDGIPHLTGLIQSPIIHLDGHITMVRGYDEVSEFYYDPGPALELPDIPEAPTKEEIQEAVSFLCEPFIDFPFYDDETSKGAELNCSSFCNVISCLISVTCRNLINGPVPMLFVSKPTMGTGSSKIAEIISQISTGAPLNVFQQQKNDEEWRKSITTKISSGPPFVVIDNAEGKVHSQYLSALLTLSVWRDRILGQSKDAAFPHNSVWMVNGNNIRLGGDLPRRCYPCRLDAQEAQPWERDNFKHKDVIKWTVDNRGGLLASILTIVRGWIHAGCPGWNRPEGVKPLGGFEAWSNVVGGILSYAGFTGFLKNQQVMYQQIDSDSLQWDGFFEVWYEKFGEKSITVNELVKQLISEEEEYTAQRVFDGSNTTGIESYLLDTLPEMVTGIPLQKQAFKVKLGSALARCNGRVFPSGYMLTQDGEKKRAKKWKVVLKIRKEAQNEERREEGESRTCGIVEKTGAFQGIDSQIKRGEGSNETTIFS